jgi:hypothetical protein
MDNTLNKGDMAKVFDYGNEIFDEIVTIISHDTYSDVITYMRNDNSEVVFSGYGYFEREII